MLSFDLHLLFLDGFDRHGHQSNLVESFRLLFIFRSRNQLRHNRLNLGSQAGARIEANVAAVMSMIEAAVLFATHADPFHFAPPDITPCEGPALTR